VQNSVLPGSNGIGPRIMASVRWHAPGNLLRNFRQASFQAPQQNAGHSIPSLTNRSQNACHHDRYFIAYSLKCCSISEAFAIRSAAISSSLCAVSV